MKPARAVLIGVLACGIAAAQSAHVFTVIATPNIGEVDFRSTNNTNYVGLMAPASVTSNVVFKLPAADGSAGSCLVTDGSANLSLSGICTTFTPPVTLTYAGTSPTLTVRNTGSGIGLSADTAAFSWTAFGNGASVLDSSGTGYVLAYGDNTIGDQGNEARGFSFNNRIYRTTADPYPGGWDNIGGAVIVTLTGAMNLPVDTNCATQYGVGVQYCTYGNQIAGRSELYYVHPSPGHAYYTSFGTNYQAALEEIDTGVDLRLWAGFTVNQPGFFNNVNTPYPNGVVDHGYGVWVLNLDDTWHNLVDTAAIQIEGAGQYGQIRWQPGGSVCSPCAPGGSLYLTNATDGIMEMSASTRWQTATSIPLFVGGAAANAAVQAGSYGIGGSTIIDGSQNISVNGYVFSANYLKTNGNVSANVNGSPTNGGGFCVNTTCALTYETADSGIDLTNVVKVTTSGNISANGSSTTGLGYYLGTTKVISLEAGAVIDIGNVYNLTTTSEVVTNGHLGSGSGSGAGFGLYIGSNQVIDGNSNALLATVGTTGNVTANTAATNGAGFCVNTTCALTWVTADSGIDVTNIVKVTASGNISADTALGIAQGYYIGTTKVISNESGNLIDIGNVYNLNTTNTVITGGHLGAGSGSGATFGLYIGSNQVIDGNSNALLATASTTGNITSNTSITNGEGFCINTTCSLTYVTADSGVDLTNTVKVTTTGNISANGALGTGLGFYLGTTKIISYESGAVIDIGNVYNVTAGNTVSGAAVQATSTGMYSGGTQFVDNSRNLVNIGSISMSGSCTGCYASLTNANITSAVGQALNTGASPTWAAGTFNGTVNVTSGQINTPYLSINSLSTLDNTGDGSFNGYVYAAGGMRVGAGTGTSGTITSGVCTMHFSGGIMYSQTGC